MNLPRLPFGEATQAVFVHIVWRINAAVICSFNQRFGYHTDAKLLHFVYIIRRVFQAVRSGTSDNADHDCRGIVVDFVEVGNGSEL